MLTTVIVDDEPRNIEVLTRLVTDFCSDTSVIGTASSVDDAVTLIQATRPNLVFLDIEMPGKNAFDLIDLLSPVFFEIVFVTAFEQYATRAFRYSALDYLLKPVGIKELREAIERAKAQIGKHNILDRLDNYFDVTMRKSNKIAIPVNDGYNFFNYHDIVCCSAENSYTQIFLVNGSKLLSSSNLKHFTELLPHDIFCRIHHSHLINLEHAVKYSGGRSGTIELSTGLVLEVSQRKKDELLSRFSK
jgi:two-component system, LytTR family, response regulator